MKPVKPIKPGEIDYSQSPFKPGECKCGISDCRGHQVDENGRAIVENHPLARNYPVTNKWVN